MKLTTPILAVALIASLAGNAVQYSSTDKAAPENMEIGVAVTDEREGTIQNPINTQPSQQEIIWDVWATFAVTYEVDAKEGTPGGGTVTIAMPDPKAPRPKRQKEKPGLDDIDWQPNLEGFENVQKVEVRTVYSRGLKVNTE